MFESRHVQLGLLLALSAVTLIDPLYVTVFYLFFLIFLDVPSLQTPTPNTILDSWTSICLRSGGFF